MKFLSLVTLLALALTATHAAPCTVQEVDDAASKPEILAVKARCYNLDSGTSSDNSDAANKLTCEKNKDCILAMTAAMSAIPDCTVDGENLRETFKTNQKKIISTCEKLGIKVSGAATVGASATVVLVVAAAVLAQA